MVKAGLQAIYLSGWQVAADANLAGHTYPDQSLYPANSGPALARSASTARCCAPTRSRTRRATTSTYWLAPIVADAEAGFGGPLNAFEIMKAYIEAGAAAVHFEDQLSSEKKCGHLGGKVLVPTSQFVRTLVAARLAADVADVPSLIVARTDALSATLLTSDVDEADREFCTGERTPEGFYRVQDGIEPRSRAASPTRRTRISSGSRRPHPTWTRRSSSQRRCTSGSPASGSRTTARRRSTGGATSPTREIAGFQRASPRWATGSSSSPWPASTPSTCPCSSSRAATATRRCPPTSPPGARVRARGRGLHGDPASARGRRRLLRPRHGDDRGRRRLDARADAARPRRGSSRRRASMTRHCTTTSSRAPFKTRGFSGQHTLERCEDPGCRCHDGHASAVASRARPVGSAAPNLSSARHRCPDGRPVRGRPASARRLSAPHRDACERRSDSADAANESGSA